MKELKELLGACLDVNAYDLDSLVDWIRDSQNEGLAGPGKRRFRQELENAIAAPGSVSVMEYKKWTGQSFQNQEALQRHFQEIWDACFGDR